MGWEIIVLEVKSIREESLKSHKCLQVDRETNPETVNGNVNTLRTQLEKLGVLLNTNYSILTEAYQTSADTFYSDLREKLISVSFGKNIKVLVPYSLHEPIVFKRLPEIEPKQKFTMPQTILEFLNTAVRLISDFNGNFGNLQSFSTLLT